MTGTGSDGADGIGRTTSFPFAVEPTEAGAQALVPGVLPIDHRRRLELRAAAPLVSRRPQRPCDLGLFDLGARNQLDLFQERGA